MGGLSTEDLILSTSTSRDCYWAWLFGEGASVPRFTGSVGLNLQGG
jgi:hypothetical protein